MEPIEGFIDYYELLGLSPNAGTELIKRAYKIGAKNAHPDSGGSEAQFRNLQKAYETLIDDFKRKEYDEIYKRVELLKYNNINEEKQDYEEQIQSTNSSAKESATVNDEPSIFKKSEKEKIMWSIIASIYILLLLFAKLFN